MIDRVKKIYDKEDLKQKVKDREVAITFWRDDSRKWEKKCNELEEENQKLKAWIEGHGGVVE